MVPGPRGPEALAQPVQHDPLALLAAQLAGPLKAVLLGTRELPVAPAPLGAQPLAHAQLLRTPQQQVLSGGGTVQGDLAHLGMATELDGYLWNLLAQPFLEPRHHGSIRARWKRKHQVTILMRRPLEKAPTATHKASR